MGSTAIERAGADERDAITAVALLERRIARPVRAEHVLDGPVVAGREQSSAQAGLCAEPFALAAGLVQQDRNFPQDSLRRTLYAFSYWRTSPRGL